MKEAATATDVNHVSMVAWLGAIALAVAEAPAAEELEMVWVVKGGRHAVGESR